MKIQELAIVFILIILPISLVLSEYTQFQIQTLNKQAEYDAKLTSATYDAIKAFQLNATNSSESGMAMSKLRDLTASVNSFRNSIMSTFKLNGYTEEEINNYIPALVYTLYDGFYIYSPFKNYDGIDAAGNHYYNKDSNEKSYGLKSYISYSCRYIKGSTDVVITYALDNFIKVEGYVNGSYVSKSGYLVDGITVSGSDVTYNGVDILDEQLTEYLPLQTPGTYPYIKYNGVKYYLDEAQNRVIYVANGKVGVQYQGADNDNYKKWRDKIKTNDFAKQYYIQAEEFTSWFRGTVLNNLKYEDAYGDTFDAGGNPIQIWPGNTNDIFKDPGTTKNIENELSNFNQHRLKVIRYKIEQNLAMAIANYNNYSNVTNVFQMPSIKEDEWDSIINNISLISFLQGLPIGGKLYNGYSIVTNSESKEVVLEENIYILSTNATNIKTYNKVRDNGFKNGTILVDNGYGGSKSAGRLNLDFKKVILTNNNGQSIYYYPLHEYDASYDSIVMQNNVDYENEDVYDSVNNSTNDVKQAFYTALGRERAGKYNTNIKINI